MEPAPLKGVRHNEAPVARSTCEDGSGLYISIGVNVLLFLLIAGLAGSVDIRSLRAQLRRRLGIGCGLLCQFFLMPLIGYSVVSLMKPEPHVGLVLLILCSSSGGAYSNWWCSLFNADLALSVAMTAVSTMMCALMMPINLLLYLSLLGKRNDIDMPWVPLFQGLGVVFSAIVAGICISSRLPKLKTWMNRIGNAAGVSMIVITLLASLVAKKEGASNLNQDEPVKPLWGHEPGFYLVVAMPFFISIAASLFISSLRCLNLRRPERVAIVVEVCYQNIGVASAVGIAAFCGNKRQLADAAAVPVIYGLLEAVCLAIFCLVMWKCGWTYSPTGAGLAAAIRGDFQPVLPECPADQPVVEPPKPGDAVGEKDEGDVENPMALEEISNGEEDNPDYNPDFACEDCPGILPASSSAVVVIPMSAKVAPKMCPPGFGPDASPPPAISDIGATEMGLQEKSVQTL